LLISFIMSDIEVKMTFKLLPNEILLLCFGYLNATDLFYAFDCLNSRLNKIIQNIPLCLDLGFVRQLPLIDFFDKMIPNPQIKEQITAMRLTDRVTCRPTQMFLSSFSLKEFTNLQSLKLIYLSSWDMKQILPILPYLLNLRCFDYSHWKDEFEASDLRQISLPASNIETLSLPKLYNDALVTGKYLKMTKLTIMEDCSINELCKLFEYTPRLKYLITNRVYKFGDLKIDKQRQSHQSAIDLKYLTVRTYNGGFNSFEVLFMYTPNLQSLVVEDNNSLTLMDAEHWEQLIISALLLLNVLKFYFRTSFHRCGEKHIVDLFGKFQSDFWHKQHLLVY
jgi:hypothetical protein